MTEDYFTRVPIISDFVFMWFTKWDRSYCYDKFIPQIGQIQEFIVLRD
jgi:hypothetical protein